MSPTRANPYVINPGKMNTELNPFFLSVENIDLLDKGLCYNRRLFLCFTCVSTIVIKHLLHYNNNKWNSSVVRAPISLQWRADRVSGCSVIKWTPSTEARPYEGLSLTIFTESIADYRRSGGPMGGLVAGRGPMRRRGGAWHACPARSPTIDSSQPPVSAVGMIT